MTDVGARVCYAVGVPGETAFQVFTTLEQLEEEVARAEFIKGLPGEFWVRRLLLPDNIAWLNTLSIESRGDFDFARIFGDRDYGFVLVRLCDHGLRGQALTPLMN